MIELESIRVVHDLQNVATIGEAQKLRRYIFLQSSELEWRHSLLIGKRGANPSFVISFQFSQDLRGVGFRLIVDHLVVHRAQEDQVFNLIDLFGGIVLVVAWPFSLSRNNVAFFADDCLRISGGCLDNQLTSTLRIDCRKSPIKSCASYRWEAWRSFYRFVVGAESVRPISLE